MDKNEQETYNKWYECQNYVPKIKVIESTTIRTV